MAYGRDDQPDDPRVPNNPPGSSGADPALRQQIYQWYQQYLGRTPSEAEVNQWAMGPSAGNAQAIQQGIQGSDEAKRYAASQAPQTPQAPPPGGGAPGGSGAPTGSLYGPFGPFTEPFQAPTWNPLPQAPTWKDIPTFTPPTMADAQQDPGYAFGLQQGEQALTQDKAQQGLLYGGGTLKDILSWGQNYATQRYNDLYNRQKDTFTTNTENQYVLPYQQQMAQWQTLVPAAQRQNEFQYNAAYQKWLADYQQWQNNRGYALDVATRLG